MSVETMRIGQSDIPVLTTVAAVVGSGAAGFACALNLKNAGVDVMLVTEGVNCGTSRNTGSDKQTYYKLGLAGDTPDSVHALAQNLFDGGAMDGDNALVQAALSARCFYKLVELGVPFPHNEAGEFVGYKTDHDPARRATSCGPLTSKWMTQQLEKEAATAGVTILDGLRVVEILKDGDSVCGLLCVDVLTANFQVVLCTSVVYATGGPAGIYLASVFPPSQFGGSGAAFLAGAAGVNLTEWQFGLASTKFRWNLSGTYQQVLPRYVSTDENGQDAREFLRDYFESDAHMLEAVFLKGYQWPFDSAKVQGGSSVIDMAVYHERKNGRRVFLDFLQNPQELMLNGQPAFDKLLEESAEYLRRSGADQQTPFERLMHMNPDAVKLYRDNGIDLQTEWLEIDLCAQHHNGGLLGDAWRQSNVLGFFAIGECGGTFGVRRPGGSALNDTQVGALRAAQWIAKKRNVQPDGTVGKKRASKALAVWQQRLQQLANNAGTPNVMQNRAQAQQRMSLVAGALRSQTGIENAIFEVRNEIASFWQRTVPGKYDTVQALYNYDMLITQLCVLAAMQDYAKHGGGSRGSALYLKQDGQVPVPALSQYAFDMGKNLESSVQEVRLEQSPQGMDVVCTWRPVRPVPALDDWFEKVWANYRADGGVRPVS